MKIGLLHFAYRANQIENNVKKIITGIETASAEGAKWVVTPEMAVQGYFFSEANGEHFKNISPLMDLVPILSTAIKTKTRVFVGALEKTGENKFFNSCYLISPNGDVEDTQRKSTGHNVGAEAWSTKGSSIKKWNIDNIDLSILVCADSWYEDKQNNIKNTDLVLVPAAWPNVDVGGGLPEEAWKKCSLKNKGMVIACNQTGKEERMNMESSKSAVVVNGNLIFEYAGKDAILLLDIVKENNKLKLKESAVVNVDSF